MSTTGSAAGAPPRSVTLLLRLEGLTVLAGAVIGYHLAGDSWWLFALLILAPDLSMLGMLRSPGFGARAYNAAHTYSLPLILAGLAWLAGADWLLPYALIWTAHNGMDRSLGYGLKYPGQFEHTHLGRLGNAKRAQRPADAG